MGFKVYGTDISEKMADFSRINLSWLAESWSVDKSGFIVETADATSYCWQKPIDIVASETYLGPPLKKMFELSEQRAMLSEINQLHKKFLLNLADQVPKNSRICLAVPAWQTNQGFVHLPILDQLPVLGYNRVVFEHAHINRLIYYRPEQLVARELVTLIRK
jgi:tRNA G10  N-methylase Trm11